MASCPPGFAVPWARCRRCRAPLAADGAHCTGIERHPGPRRSLRYYATWTSTRQNLAALHAMGGGLVVGPDQLTRYRGETPPLSWVLDNGAWGCFTRGEAFDAGAFREAVSRWAYAADWIAIPDVVGDAAATLDAAGRWYDELAATRRPLLLVVQDGMTPDDVAPWLARGVGLFVGGSTAWKESSLPMWGRVKAATSCHLHVGRVNTARRMQLAIDAGANSADGTSITRFAATGPKLRDAAAAEPRAVLL